jgi:WD40 repeat protein
MKRSTRNQRRWIIRLMLLVWLCGLSATTRSQALTQRDGVLRAPVLRIETGLHTAAITEISVDATNRFLVTASFDKTVRLWELPSGRLLRTLRVPIGEGSDGKLYSVAISPDGGTIAVGGFTASAGDWSNIYLFDRATGVLIKRIGGLPNAVTYLTYSHNGQYLAATLGDNGFRIYSSESYALAGEDQACRDSGLSADFDRGGRLVTACYDGVIRLYAPVGSGPPQLLFKRKIPGGQPASVKFSPDGSRVAVGLVGSANVAVLSAQDLTPLYTPDTSGVSNGDLAKVAWSADGKTLYAGGLYVDPSLSASSRVIRAWADGGRGDYRDVEAAHDTITHILPLSDGGIIYSSADPAFGIIDGTVRRTLFVVAQKADYRVGQSSFLTSSDGTGIQFGYEPFGQAPAHFSVTSRRLDMGTAANSDWRAPVTKAEGLVITDWRETAFAKLNGKTLTLLPNEISRALAIAPDDRGFLIGASWSLYLFDRMGKPLWRVPAPDTTWAVNVTGDGKTAVAAFADGTIRWYRMEDGQELLAFYPCADRKRWVSWTASGYYDASPGAEELIGWHLNNGRDMAADFFPIKQVESFFHRRDVIAETLKLQDETRAIRVANGVLGRQDQRVEVGKVLPPVVDMMSLRDVVERTAGEVWVRFRTRTPTGEPVTSVQALVDGRPAQSKETAKVAAGRDSNIIEMKVFVEGSVNQISIVAQNKYSASVPASVEVHRNRLKL